MIKVHVDKYLDTMPQGKPMGPLADVPVSKEIIDKLKPYLVNNRLSDMLHGKEPRTREEVFEYMQRQVQRIADKPPPIDGANLTYEQLLTVMEFHIDSIMSANEVPF